MSALQNALTGIRCTLEQSGIPLRWKGFDEDITGFSRHVPWEFGLAFQQRLEKMLLAEEEELVRPKQEHQEARSQSEEDAANRKR